MINSRVLLGGDALGRALDLVVVHDSVLLVPVLPLVLLNGRIQDWLEHIVAAQLQTPNLMRYIKSTVLLKLAGLY